MRDADLIAGLRDRLAAAGLSGSFLVRDLASGEEIAIDPDRAFPIASLVKVPLAIAVLEAIRCGRLDGATALEVLPGRDPGAASSPGIAKFAHPVRIAVDDLLYLAIAISDNAAADALFDLVPPAEVDRVLADAGIGGITVRHPMRELYAVAVGGLGRDGVEAAHAIALGARTPGGGHSIAQLDLTRANTGTARAIADLLAALWTPSALHPEVAARTRALMRNALVQRRLGPDFMSDSTTWASKSGTLLNLRHDAGVVEHEGGEAYAIVALTESTVPAAAQPAAEALMGHVARSLHDHLRDR
jgi:beta-lactamase class A